MGQTTVIDPAEVEQVMGRLVSDIAATAGLQMTSLGIRTGLWRALADGDPHTPADVAQRTGVAEPYAREWLKHQVASGYLEHDPAAGAFSLPPAVAAVLADDVQSGLVEGFATMLEAMSQDRHLIEQAFTTGAGLGWHQRSHEHWYGMDRLTRSAVVPALVSQWVPALGLHERLRAGSTVADVGCGLGAVLIELARAYPASRFWGFDPHDASVAQARKAAAEAGVADRVTFEVAAAADVPALGFELVLLVDTLHDLGDPVGALRQVRRALGQDGRVLLVEFAAGDRLEDNLTPLGRLQLAASALVCTPNAVAQGSGDPLGTIPGEARLRAVAADAGYRRVGRVDAGAPLNLLLELRP